MVVLSSIRALPMFRHLQGLCVTSTTIVMRSSTSSARRALAYLSIQPNVATPIQPTILPSDVPIEEELVRGYDPRHFYPVNPGEILDNRYEMMAKLGCGSSSTVWLGRITHRYVLSLSSLTSLIFSRQKWRSNHYVAVKVNTCDFADEGAAGHELDISQCIAQANPRHKGFSHVRIILDSFKIKGPHGDHLCLVYELMREPLWLFERRCKNGRFMLGLIKLYLRYILMGLDYLHSECHIVHTGMLKRYTYLETAELTK